MTLKRYQRYPYSIVALSIFWMLSICGLVKSALQSGQEKTLYRHVTSGYNSISRPVRNASTKVPVQFGISLNQILDLGVASILCTGTIPSLGFQVTPFPIFVWSGGMVACLVLAMSTICSFLLPQIGWEASSFDNVWKDENIHWSPENFNGLDRLMLPSIHLWVPDIYIFNIAGSALDGFVNVTGSYLVVYSNGSVHWSIPLLIKSSCEVDATYFPYDRQNCQIQFGSWIYDGSQLDITEMVSKPDLSSYVEANEFELLNASLSRMVADDKCCPGSGSHPMIIFKLELKRKTIYYDYIVIAPTINLCVLTLSTFLLPCECGWKIAIGLTVFLTLYVLQLLIAENVPDTNATPLIGVFLLLVMTLNCVSLIMATFVMNIKKRAHQDIVVPVPPLLLDFCEKYLSKVVCTRLDDWRKMAHEPHIGLFEDNDSVNLRTSLDSVNHDIEEIEMQGHSMRKNYTAESLGAQAVDTDRLLATSRQSSSHEQYFSNTNLSFMLDEDVTHDDPHDTEVSEHIIVESGGSNFESIIKPRKRPSYRKAVRNSYAPSSEARRREFQRRRHLYNRQSVFSGAELKYQWYFIAEVVDKCSFLVYIVCMFVGIVTVLLIVPAFA